MHIFYRHKIASLALSFYALWWVHVFYWFASDASRYPNSCGLANAGLLFLTTCITGIYSLTLLISLLTREREVKKRLWHLFTYRLTADTVFIFETGVVKTIA